MFTGSSLCLLPNQRDLSNAQDFDIFCSVCAFMSVYCVVYVHACLYVDSLVHVSVYGGQRSKADVFLWCALCTLFNPEPPVSARVARHFSIPPPTAGVTVRLSQDSPSLSPVLVSSGY